MPAVHGEELSAAGHHHVQFPALGQKRKEKKEQTMLKALLKDEAGFVISTELMLVATILVIGLIVGQATLRDQVVTELADVADAISAVDQSYQISDITGHSSSTAGTIFDDNPDFCDANDAGAQGTAADDNTCVRIDGGADAEAVDDTAGAAPESP